MYIIVYFIVSIATMKISAIALVAIMGMLGVALGMGYGYSGYSYVPYYGGATQGAGDGSICKSPIAILLIPAIFSPCLHVLSSLFTVLP